MTPFQIGQTLFVQFGTRQAFTVAAISGERCAMRFPNSTFVRWYTVADLLLWNPCRAIVNVSIPVQYPAIVPGLRIQRPALRLDIGGVLAQDYTVVCVMGGYAFIRHNAPAHIAGSIHSRPLRTFWHSPQPKVSVSYEPVHLSGKELHDIAEQWRDLVRTGNPLTTIWRRFNAGLDKLTPDQWDTLQAGWDYRRTERLLQADLRKVAS